MAFPLQVAFPARVEPIAEHVFRLRRALHVTSFSPADQLCEALAEEGSPLEILLDIQDGVPAAMRSLWSEELCRAYWGQYDGFLMPRKLRESLVAGDDLVAEEAALIRSQTDAPEAWERALQVHSATRLRVFGYHARGWVDEEMLFRLQMVADWTLHQRAVRDDLRKMTAAAGRHEHLAGVAKRFDDRDMQLGGGRVLLSRRVFAHLSAPKPMMEALDPKSPVCGEVTVDEVIEYATRAGERV